MKKLAIVALLIAGCGGRKPGKPTDAGDCGGLGQPCCAVDSGATGCAEGLECFDNTECVPPPVLNDSGPLADTGYKGSVDAATNKDSLSGLSDCPLPADTTASLDSASTSREASPPSGDSGSHTSDATLACLASYSPYACGGAGQQCCDDSILAKVGLTDECCSGFLQVEIVGRGCTCQ